MAMPVRTRRGPRGRLLLLLLCLLALAPLARCALRFPELAREARAALEIYGPIEDASDDASVLSEAEAQGVFDRAQASLARSPLAFVDSSGYVADADAATTTARDAVDLARASAVSGHREGVALFARLMILGAVPKNASDGPAPGLERSWALRLLAQSAEFGSPAAQTYLGLLYSAGIEPISSDPPPEVAAATDDAFSVPQSLLYLYMGATGGDTLAHLALGWRHSLGIGVPKSCQAAVLYYDTPAYILVDKTREPGSTLRHASGAPNKDRISSSDALKSVRWQKHAEDTFVGKFKSAYNRVVARGSNSEPNGRYETDMVQYYEYRASSGHAAAQTAMGEVHLSGSNGVPQDFQKAAEYFELARLSRDREAIAQLGHMHANGVGVDQSNTTAMAYFQEAADLGSAHGMYGLGYMYLSGFTEDYGGSAVEGRGGEGSEGSLGHGSSSPSNINIDKAILYLSKASDRGHVEAIFLLGVMYLNGWNANSKRIIAKVRDVIHDKTNVALAKESDAQKAYHYLQVAAYAGHPIAMYNTAMMRLLGMGTQASCSGALELLKPLAERLSPETKLLEYALKSMADKVDNAALAYLLGAYSGMEAAQTNAAYVLQHGAIVDFDPVTFGDGQRIASAEIDNQRQVIKFHKYAAEQGNMGSLLAIGDIYFYGYGVPVDREKAGKAYRRAAEIAGGKKMDDSTLAGGRQKNKKEDSMTPPIAVAYAYFNLGIMHQLGIGLPQDLHLAKRFYDLAQGSHATALGPCTIALFALRVHRTCLDVMAWFL